MKPRPKPLPQTVRLCTLEKCGYKYHKTGCYVRIRPKDKVSYSDNQRVIIDYDRYGRIVGIDFHSMDDYNKLMRWMRQ